jgi:hypothetical protein
MAKLPQGRAGRFGGGKMPSCFFLWDLPRESGIPIISNKWVATVPAVKGQIGSTHEAENHLDPREHRAAGNFELIEES